MNFATRIVPGILKNRKMKRSSGIFDVNEMTIAHIPKTQVMTTGLSFVGRIKNQLQRSFWKKDVALIRPHSYEIQVLPAHASKVSSSNLYSSTSASAIPMCGPSFSGKYWPANNPTREKLAHTSSNLG